MMDRSVSRTVSAAHVPTTAPAMTSESRCRLRTTRVMPTPAANAYHRGLREGYSSASTVAAEKASDV